MTDALRGISDWSERHVRAVTIGSERWALVALIVTPVVAGLAARELPIGRLAQLTVVMIGIGVIVAVSLRPNIAMVSFVVGFAIAAVLLPVLFRFGVSVSVVRWMGYWKEAMLAAVAIAVLRRPWQRLDTIDWAALILTLLVVVYYLLPNLFPPGGGIPVAQQGRLVGMRNILVMPAALLLCRRLPMDAVWRRRMATGMIVAGFACGVVAMYEVAFQESFKTFLDRTLHLPDFDFALRDIARPLIFNTKFGDGSIQRAGTLWRNPVLAGFAFLAPLAIALDRTAREGATPRRVAALGAIGVGLVLTGTRSSIISGAVVVAVILSRRAGLSSTARTRYAIALILVGLSVAPFLAGTAIVDRFSAAVEGSDESTQIHKSSSGGAYDLVIDHPFGRGLGSAGGNSIRYDVQGRSIAENYYLQLATEAGIAATLAFGAMVLLSIRRILFVGTGTGIAVAAAAGMIGLSVNGYFLHSFENPISALPAFALLGVALAAVPAEERGAPAP